VKYSSSVSVVSVKNIDVFGLGDEVGEGEFRPADIVCTSKTLRLLSQKGYK
jgi:hypothetical protein